MRSNFCRFVLLFSFLNFLLLSACKEKPESTNQNTPATSPTNGKNTADDVDRSLLEFAKANNASSTWISPIDFLGAYSTLDFQRSLQRLKGEAVAIRAKCIDLFETSGRINAVFTPIFSPIDIITTTPRCCFFLIVDEAAAEDLLTDMHDDNFLTEYLITMRIEKVMVAYQPGHRASQEDDPDSTSDPEVEHVGTQAEIRLDGRIERIKKAENNR